MKKTAKALDYYTRFITSSIIDSGVVTMFVQKKSKIMPRLLLAGGLLLSIPATVSAATSAAVSWIPEPGSAAQPWVIMIDSAKSSVYINDYIITDKPIVQALVAAAKRGVNVRVIADAHPYDDSSAVTEERSEFANTKVQIHFWSPSANSFDHAKYLVADGKSAIVGSANADYSAMEGGDNLEGDVAISGGTIPDTLTKLFVADWSHKSATVSNASLIISPGAESGIIGLLKQPGVVSVASEELGSEKAILQTMQTKGKQLRLLLPDSVSSSDLNNARALAAHGVQVRLLKSPYVHAKVIVSAAKLFVGSENLTTTSLTENREVGVVVEQKSVIRQASAWFSTYWAKATPLTATSKTATETSTSNGSYPYLPLGLSESEVRARWGSPSSVSTTTYHGEPETVWHYPNGDECYFNTSGKLVYVHRSK